MPQALSLVVPVYNEGDGFAAFWQRLTSDLQVPFIANIVYDFDEDNTLPVLRSILEAGETRIRMVKNAYGRGVVGALRTGFDAVEQGPVLVVMADLSDDLGAIPDMLRLYEEGNQVVVGSRYMKGGKIIGGPWLKQLLSRISGVTLCWFRGLPTHDATNAFKIYDAAMLKKFTIESQGGFEINLEITVKAFLAGYKIAETPSTWRDRTAGESKFKMWAWMPRYLKWYFYAFQQRSRDSIGKHGPAKTQ